MKKCGERSREGVQRVGQAQLVRPYPSAGMLDIISFALGGITVAFMAIVARMGGDCWGAAEKVKEDPKQLYQQFKVEEMSFESRQHKPPCC